jgi:hypothetical protein
LQAVEKNNATPVQPGEHSRIWGKWEISYLKGRVVEEKRKPKEKFEGF